MMRDTSQLGKVWAERMTKSERDTSFPDSEPRDAATMMLIDRSGPVPKVLLGRRHHGHKFMPGKFVFPGGRIEALDATMSAVSEIHPDMAAKLNERVANASPQFARALALTAIREVAEETGLLLGVKGSTAPQTPGEIWREFAKACVHPIAAPRPEAARNRQAPRPARPTGFFALPAAFARR